MLAHVPVSAYPRSRPALRPGRGLFLPMTRTAPQLDLLVQQVAQTRDRAAFQALFTHFAPRIKGYLIRLGAPAAQAEDLAQEAMLTLWRKAHLFDPARASAATWVFTIARNLRIDVIRRERRPELTPEDFLPEPEAEPDEALAAADGEGRVRAALRTLPPEQVQVVELSFFSDKPHSQIAAELDIPLGTVKSRLRLAMARLRAHLGESLLGDG